jgi:hypothetical protein
MPSNKRSPHLIFLIIGVLLFLLSYALVVLAGERPSESQKFWSGALQTLAFVLLTVVVVDVLWRALGGEPVSKTLEALGNALAELRASVLLLRDSASVITR